MSYSDKKWKEHLIWKHGVKTLIPKQFTETRYNRYYHRGSSPYNINTPNCCDTYLEHNRNYGNNVVSNNNPYYNDNPSFSNYFIYSIFENKLLTKKEIDTIVEYYNNNFIIDNPEKLYGPFSQKNINIISETAYNEKNWNEAWKKYGTIYKLNLYNFPDLYKIVHSIENNFVTHINKILYLFQIKNPIFHAAKNKIISINRSDQTQYIKYTINIVLVRNIKSKTYVFEVIAYYNPDKNIIVLGKITFIGSGTTDTILLPKGQDIHTFEDTGRPLHPLEAKNSEIISEEEANTMYWKELYEKNNFTKNITYNNNLPYWFSLRQ